MLPGWRRRRARQAIAVGVLVGLAVAAACSASGDDAEPSTPSTAADPAASAEPPASNAEPALEVLVTGDSVMQQVAAAVVDAVDGPEVQARFASTIAIADQPETVVGWETVMAVEPPDVVVVMVGTWERDAVRAGLAQGGWPAPYLDQVAPFVETLTAAGAEVVWLTYPPGDGDEASDIAALNEAVAALPDRFPGVAVVDAGAEVAGPSGERLRTLVGPDGVEQAVREESVHLCPDGVVLVAAPVVADLAERLGFTPRSGWEQGEWRDDPTLFTDPAACEV
jgi:hypothetical protein